MSLDDDFQQGPSSSGPNEYECVSESEGDPLSKVLSSAILLSVTWLLLSGPFTLEKGLVLSFGIGSVALVLWISQRMGVLHDEGRPIRYGWGFALYIPWLLKEIVVANLQVARAILSPRLPISPRMIRIKPTQKTDVGRVIYANSITLTPGTVTVAVEGDEFVIHSLLADEATEDIQDTTEGSMDWRVSQLEVIE